MKTATRLLLGIVSTLLLTAGFARAAEQFDPVIGDMATVSFLPTSEGNGGTNPSTPPCEIPDDEIPE